MLTRLTAYARHYCRSHAEDAALRAIEELGPSAPRHALFSRTRHLATVARRAEVRRQRREAEYARTRREEVREADAVDPLAYLDFLTDRRQHEVVTRVVLGGESQAEVAKFLKVSQPTVSRLYARGIATIRESLGLAC